MSNVLLESKGLVQWTICWYLKRKIVDGANRTWGQSLQINITDADTYQPYRRKAYCGCHFPNLTKLTFGYDDTDP
jgi:hypothetical protein